MQVKEFYHPVVVTDDADMAMTRVGDYVTLAPASASPEEDSQEVAARMLELGVRHLPVVDHGEVVGMLSVRDLLVLAAWQPAQ
jgi:CBS domain-containing protein